MPLFKFRRLRYTGPQERRERFCRTQRGNAATDFPLHPRARRIRRKKLCRYGHILSFRSKGEIFFEFRAWLGMAILRPEDLREPRKL